MAAKNIYAAQIEKSIQAIESGKSVKDQAIVMKENVFNPKENFCPITQHFILVELRRLDILWLAQHDTALYADLAAPIAICTD